MLLLVIIMFCLPWQSTITAQTVSEANNAEQSQLSAARSQVKVPARLAIYYGFPSLINRSNSNLTQAIAAFANYDLIVLGDGVEFNDIQPQRKPPGVGTAEHKLARRLIKQLQRSRRNTRIFGYIDLGNSQNLTLKELKNRVQLWANMGVKGIFLDEAGYDYGVTRARQNAIISFIHELNLSAFVNGFNPDDLFSDRAVPLNNLGGGNPEGEPTELNRADIYLLESFQIRMGEYDEGELNDRIRRALSYREQFGTRIFGVTTSQIGQSFEQAKFDYAWWGSLMWGLDGFGWGEPSFSSADNLMPYRTAPTIGDLGVYTSPVIEQFPLIYRETTGGRIFINTQNHTAGITNNR